MIWCVAGNWKKNWEKKNVTCDVFFLVICKQLTINSLNISPCCVMEKDMSELGHEGAQRS
jgi:hypothetical protein